VKFLPGHDVTSARILARGVLTSGIGVSCCLHEEDDGGENGALVALHHAVSRGYTFLDTADSCGAGRAERLIGQFLRRYPGTTVQLSSKVGRVVGSAPHPLAGRHIQHQLEQSLENLYAEQLDLYTLDSVDFGPDDRYLGNAVDMMGTLRDLGYIKAIGLRGPHANGSVPPAEWAERINRFLRAFLLLKPDVVWLTFNAYTPLIELDGEDLLSFISRHGVGMVLAVSGIGDGAAARRRELDYFVRSSRTTTKMALNVCLRRFPNSVAVVRATQGRSSVTIDGLAVAPIGSSASGESYSALRARLHDRAESGWLRSLLDSGPRTTS
jgi:aryl-alcohol dehydrogenase-like predicted oxidoreductase